MKIAGIIAEYNPFHNGHAYQINKCRELTGCDDIVAIMSGDYTQRGEPAIVNKYLRAEMALLNGVDIVIELPSIFSMASAEYFAFSSVYLLNATNSVDLLCFGSEETDIEKLSAAADVLLNESDDFKHIISTKLKSGMSFATARHEAANEVYVGTLPLRDPNSILGVEYIKALKKLESSIVPFAVQRTGAGHDSSNFSGCFASASAIRNSAKIGHFYEIERVMPSNSLDLLKSASRLTDIDDFSPLLHYVLFSRTDQKLAEIFDMSEGLHNRIISAAKSIYLISDIVKQVKTKRYTYTKIQRVIMNIILNVTKPFFNEHSGKPPYIRVLGFNKDKEYLLREIVKNSSIPVVTNIKNPCELLKFDLKASELFNAMSKSPFSEYSRNILKYSKNPYA